MKSIKIFKKPRVRYYAVAAENSYYVKEGTTEVIPDKKLDEVLKTGKFKFSYTENMHWDEDELKCIVVKETTSYELISQEVDAENE